MLATNPFQILGASPRDGSRRLLELSEMRLLTDDQAVIQKARNDLTNPRTRLKAELHWFPGLAPNRAARICQGVLAGELNDSLFGNLAPLARANALAGLVVARLASDFTSPYDAMIADLLDMAGSIEAVDASDVLLRIDEDRSVAGLPLVGDIDRIEAELQLWRTDHVLALAYALRRRGSADLPALLTELVNRATSNGAIAGPVVVHDLVVALQPDLVGPLTEHADHIHAEVAVIAKLAKTGFPEPVLLDQYRWLDTAVRSWDRVAQPMQLSSLVRGQEHEGSRDIARTLRALSLELHNDHHMSAMAERLTLLIRDTCAELARTAEQADKDLAELRGLAAARQNADLEDASARAKATYEGVIGVLFKDRVWVSPDTIGIARTALKTSDVAGFRWGGTRHSINGIPTGTSYAVILATPSERVSFETRDSRVFEGFVDALWHAVVIRLICVTAGRLRSGEGMSIGGVTFDDRSIVLQKARLFRGPLQEVFTWPETTVMSEGGALCISAASDPEFNIRLPYLEYDNVHVLDRLARARQSGRFPTLSAPLFS